MSSLPSLIPPRPPTFRASHDSLDAEVTPTQVNRQLRSLFREAFDTMGGSTWLVEFARKNDQNARVFVQAISKLLPPSAEDRGQGGVIIDVPWLTSTRLSYKRDSDGEVLDVQVKDPGPTAGA